jgi:hypothetical protein
MILGLSRVFLCDLFPFLPVVENRLKSRRIRCFAEYARRQALNIFLSSWAEENAQVLVLKSKILAWISRAASRPRVGMSAQTSLIARTGSFHIPRSSLRSNLEYRNRRCTTQALEWTLEPLLQGASRGDMAAISLYV